MDANIASKKRRRTATTTRTTTTTTTTMMSKVLPEDIEIEILRRLPVKSLLRFKSVCKIWYNLIKSVSFVTLYNTSNNGTSRKKISLWCTSYLVNNDKNSSTIYFHLSNTLESLTVAAPVEDINMAGCSHGLVCFSITTTRDKFVVWNPSTRSHRLITGSSLITPPNSLYPFTNGFCKYLRSGFLFNPITNTFKLSRICFIRSTNPSSYCVQVDIFSSSENSWRTKKIDFPSLSDRYPHLEWGTCTKRFMNWMVSNWNSGQNVVDVYILGYDMIDEVFVRVDMPSRGLYDNLMSLIRYGEFLAVFVPGRSRPNCTEVWLINNSDGMDRYSLSKEPSFTLPSTVLALGSTSKHEVDWAVLGWHGRRWLHNLETQKTMALDEDHDWRDHDWKERFFVYSESLASVSENKNEIKNSNA